MFMIMTVSIFSIIIYNNVSHQKATRITSYTLLFYVFTFVLFFPSFQPSEHHFSSPHSSRRHCCILSQYISMYNIYIPTHDVSHRSRPIIGSMGLCIGRDRMPWVPLPRRGGILFPWSLALPVPIL